MTAILTKSELAEILLVDELNFKNTIEAKYQLKEHYESLIHYTFSKTNSYFIRAFRNRNYDIKLLIASNNSKFIIS